jgi:hypothetical protein
VKSELLGRLALKPSDPPQQVEGDVAAHDGRGLQDAPLALREVIEERRDHRLHGNRDLDLADVPLHDVATRLARQGAALGQRTHRSGIPSARAAMSGIRPATLGPSPRSAHSSALVSDGPSGSSRSCENTLVCTQGCLYSVL